MPVTYDDQLIDSVRVRRSRLISALLFGVERSRRVWNDRVGTFVVSAFVGVLVCAGCIGVAFVTNLLESERAKQQQRMSGTSNSVLTPGSASSDHRVVADR
ncbi:hypothetical protein BCF74_10341 [Knoellia remsis]|uniref:Uncharacterized protein n=1 Tax=Knoellia remsis TaxID=407159 RepID=A0A2T0UY72_9MICO|nr:hypothetical protein [Knoellia remsis]PRY62834.1 hypothetical protein BCF74_10341 [Knoellia remsis]